MKKKIEGMQEFLLASEKMPRTIDAIDVKGKFMWWTMGDWKLWCTYGMSGQWSKNAHDKNTAVVVEVEDTNTKNSFKINFHDPRRFGTLKFVNDGSSHAKKLRSLGPDILESASLNPEIFAKNMLKKTNRTIAEALMDQGAVSGIGNYLRAEALFSASVDPWKCVTELSAKEYESLFFSVLQTAKSSYEAQGATIKTYRSVDGSSGTSQFFFKVYAQSSCPSGHTISRARDAGGRTIHWCSVCQT